MGNQYRNDDGIGPFVARELKRRIDPAKSGVRITEASGEGAALMEAWSNSESVIIVDLTQAGRNPGEIIRIEAHKERIPSNFFHYSSHAFGVAEAVELSRELHTLPSRLIVYAIQGKNCNAGEELSPEVLRAGHVVIEKILREIEE